MNIEIPSLTCPTFTLLISTSDKITCHMTTAISSIA
jgi:hypothetical protein